MAVEFLTKSFNKTLENERIPEEWRSVLVLIFKKKVCAELLELHKVDEPCNEVNGKSSGS